MVAGLDVRDGLDDARRLVSQHHRRRVEVDLPIEYMLVTVAHARGRGADQHLTRSRRIDLHVLDL